MITCIYLFLAILPFTTPCKHLSPWSRGLVHYTIPSTPNRLGALRE